MNFDGGFGCVPGSESHAGQVQCTYAHIHTRVHTHVDS